VADPSDAALIALLRTRDGIATDVRLRDGLRLHVMNIAWGYDNGDAWAHVTTNISPTIEDTSVEVFSTEHVEAVADEATGDILFSATL
jgi:hypothetical protein